MHSESLDFVAQKSRSFYWPLRLFPREQAAAIARLYAFCRVADDWADEGDADSGRRLLTQAIGDIQRGHSELPEITDFLKLAEAWSIPTTAAIVLLEALRNDVGSRRVLDERELLQFCYGVAGVVGLMLCPILKVTSTQAVPHAIDLGIGMQLSNIARDVVEDAERNRIYLPKVWINDLSNASAIREQSPSLISGDVRAGVTRILALAEDYYKSAERGFQYIPLRARVPIRVASGFYRRIGIEVGNDVGAIWKTKVKPSRCSLLLTFLRVLCTRPSQVAHHDDQLHELISDLPGVSRNLKKSS